MAKPSWEKWWSLVRISVTPALRMVFIEMQSTKLYCLSGRRAYKRRPARNDPWDWGGNLDGGIRQNVLHDFDGALTHLGAAGGQGSQEFRQDFFGSQQSALTE